MAVSSDAGADDRPLPRIQAFFGFQLMEAVPAPTRIATTPPMIIQTERSVGVPVKNRDISDASELDAWIPMTSRMSPMTTSAIPMGTFMASPLHARQIAPGNVKMHHHDKKYVSFG